MDCAQGGATSSEGQRSTREAARVRERVLNPDEAMADSWAGRVEACAV